MPVAEPDPPANQPDLSERPQTSTRDLGALRASLQTWLASVLPAGAAPAVGALTTPTTGGMSSETVLFDLTTPDGTESLVARLPPTDDAAPVFPRYDLERQVRIIRLVGERTDIPVPAVRWYEPDPAALGAPFIVMEQIDGAAPPDLMPYNFGSWLSEAAPADQRRLQEASVGILAELHAMAAAEQDVAFLELDAPGDTALRRHVNDLANYYDWVRGDLRIPILEATFAWIEEHWPEREGETVVSWGDSRIGNVLYRDFVPVAVLDWEMAALGPREIDLGWMIFMHSFFEFAAQMSDLDGMPGFMQRSDVVTTYTKRSGTEPRDLDFYEVYAALRHGIVMARVMLRSVHFGEAELPADPDQLVMHRPLLEEMISS